MTRTHASCLTQWPTDLLWTSIRNGWNKVHFNGINSVWQLSKKTNPWGQLMKSSFSVLPRPIHKKNKNHTCMWNGLAICTIFSHLLQDFSVVPLQTSCQHDKQSNANPTCKNQNSGHTDFWVPKFLVQQSTRRIWRNSNLANAQAQKKSNWFEHCICWIPHSTAQETPAKATSWRNAILHGMMQRQWRLMSSQVGKWTHRIWGTDPIKQQPLMLTDDFAPWHFASNKMLKFAHVQAYVSWSSLVFMDQSGVSISICLVISGNMVAFHLFVLQTVCGNNAYENTGMTCENSYCLFSNFEISPKFPAIPNGCCAITSTVGRTNTKNKAKRATGLFPLKVHKTTSTNNRTCWCLNQTSGSKQIHSLIAVESQNNTNCCRLEVGVELVSLN